MQDLGFRVLSLGFRVEGLGLGLAKSSCYKSMRDPDSCGVGPTPP